MRFKDAAIGDVILIYYTVLGGENAVSYDYSHGAQTMPALVVQQSQFDTMLGWNTLTDKIFPHANGSRTIPVGTPKGINLVQLFHNNCFCLRADKLSKVAASTEAPCKQCKQMNFISDAKCWWCEVPNPCR